MKGYCRIEFVNVCKVGRQWKCDGNVCVFDRFHMVFAALRIRHADQLLLDRPERAKHYRATV